MTNRKNNAQGTLITPEQADLSKVQIIEKHVEAFCDRIERKFDNALEFQASPILVVKAEDIEKVVTVKVSELEGYLQGVTAIKNVLTSEHGYVKTFGSLVQRMERTLEFYKPTLSETEDEAKVLKNFMTWWTSRKGFWWRAGIFCCTLGATALVGLYCYCWSDDAWARRAYDAAVEVGVEDPGRIYNEARKIFDAKGRNAAKDRIRKYEDRIRAYIDEGEQQ